MKFYTLNYKNLYCKKGLNIKKNFKLNVKKKIFSLNLYLNLWSKQKHYKYFRIKNKLPLNGQRTHTNGQTSKKILLN